MQFIIDQWEWLLVGYWFLSAVFAVAWGFFGYRSNKRKEEKQGRVRNPLFLKF